ncbi:hypothetical protein Pcinc_000400 [Petrolisthes cinctipes]|uniref:Uncharacterized protein n=1 Tax=Petrolisthes cinctipes TaxID=88211 RepID=A0AAE1L6I3_PETCI|nr:hypothetical protein Pcinc_000400 [Petrolisthes cinctipes]
MTPRTLQLLPNKRVTTCQCSYSTPTRHSDLCSTSRRLITSPHLPRYATLTPLPTTHAALHPYQPRYANPKPLATTHTTLLLCQPRNVSSDLAHHPTPQPNPTPLTTAHSSLHPYLPRNVTPTPLASTDIAPHLTTRRHPPHYDTHTPSTPPRPTHHHNDLPPCNTPLQTCRHTARMTPTLPVLPHRRNSS